VNFMCQRVRRPGSCISGLVLGRVLFLQRSGSQLFLMATPFLNMLTVLDTGRNLATVWTRFLKFHY
jgi:hypothetical protein